MSKRVMIFTDKNGYQNGEQYTLIYTDSGFWLQRNSDEMVVLDASTFYFDRSIVIKPSRGKRKELTIQEGDEWLI